MYLRGLYLGVEHGGVLAEISHEYDVSRFIAFRHIQSTKPHF